MTNFAEEIGRTPYTALSDEQRIHLAHGSLEMWAEVTAIASQEPPNVTLLCAVSSLCLHEASKAHAVQKKVLPMLIHQFAVRAATTK